MRLPSLRHVGLLLAALLLSLTAHTESLVWISSLRDAGESASKQGKLILLMAGRLTCSSCAYMKQEACEAPNVRPMIDETCVPWFADIDTTTDWLAYRAGLPSFSLPLTCVIDPRDTSIWLVRRTGLCTPTTLEGFLREALRACAPQPWNLMREQVLQDPDYRVTGHIWTNARPTEVFYRVTPGASATGPFVPAVGTSDWSAPLGPYLAAGVSNRYTFEVYAAFADASPGPTNQVSFYFHPSGPPLPVPRITAISLDHRVVRLALTNLNPGATVQVEWTPGLGATDPWMRVTNFSSAADTSIVEQADVDWPRAFYRVFTTAGTAAVAPSGHRPMP